MSIERERAAKRIFLEACELPAAERSVLLERECAGDAELRASVERLLCEDSRTRTSLRDAVVLPALDDLPLPERIGPYEITGVLGEGGMGVVYEARQSNPDRSVALKVIRGGWLTPSLRRRFEFEAAILGTLQHPGIAAIHEAGTGEDGTPYFAMERVDGVPLTDAARERDLSRSARLELFAEICDAVHHAHQKGIIHRDLKPSNILVTAEGRPKILDFGVARSVDSEGDVTRRTLEGATGEGQLVGTIPYMSPEQIGDASHTLDTRSDVYSLGVILFELFSGDLPYDLRDKSPLTQAETIRSTEPRRLGTVDRGARGDLETIVGKALEKERERRYASASELAADIRRFLADEPIAARPATAIYQLRKFARRNRGLVGSASLGVVILVVAIVLVSLSLRESNAQWERAEKATEESERQKGLVQDALAASQEERRKTQEALVESERRKEIAEDVNAFFNEDLLALADPTVFPDREITLREALDVAESRVRGRFDEEPGIRATIELTLGNTFLQLGEYERAEKCLRSALELRRAELGEDARLTLEAWQSHVSSLEALTHWAEAETEVRRLIDAWTSLDGATASSTLRNRVLLGGILARAGKLVEAETEWLEALEVAEETGDRGSTGALHQNLGDISVGLRKMDRAEFHTRKAIEILTETEGPEHPGVLRTQSNLGRLYAMQRRWQDGYDQYVRTIAVQERVLGPDHPDTLISRNSIAVMLLELDRPDEAIAAMEEVLAARRRVLREEDPSLANTLRNLGATLQRVERFEDADPYLREALALRREHLGEGHHDTLRTWTDVGQNEWDLGHHEEAIALFRRGAEGAREHLPRRMWRHGWLLDRLGVKLLTLDDPTEGETVLAEAYDAYLEALPATHSRPQGVARRLVEHFEARGRSEDAELWRGRMASEE